MKFNIKSKSALITVELGVSIVLVAVVLFVTLGLFGDNLKQLVSNGNFSRIWQNNEERTMFAAFKGRDYSTSQINVQVMGEQGLKNLRQKANNNLLKVLPDLEAVGSTQLADTATYLGLIIQNIVNNGEVCAFMEKPSNEKCKDMDLEVQNTLTISSTEISEFNHLQDKNYGPYSISVAVSNAQAGGALDPYNAIDKATKDLVDKVGKEYDMSRDLKGFQSDLEKAIQEEIKKNLAEALKKEVIEPTKATLYKVYNYNYEHDGDCNTFDKVLTGGCGSSWRGSILKKRGPYEHYAGQNPNAGVQKRDLIQFNNKFNKLLSIANSKDDDIEDIIEEIEEEMNKDDVCVRSRYNTASSTACAEGKAVYKGDKFDDGDFCGGAGVIKCKNGYTNLKQALKMDKTEGSWATFHGGWQKFKKSYKSKD